MYTEGLWVIDKQFGRLGYICNVYTECASVRWIRSKTGMSMLSSAICKFHEIEPAPLEMQQEDMEEIIELSLKIKDEDWFLSITERMGAAKNE